MKLDLLALSESLRSALVSSRNWANATEPEPSNSLRSSRFCSEVGKKMEHLVQATSAGGAKLRRRQISVPESGPRVAGEWLLDIVWTQDCWPDSRMNKDLPGIPEKIYCALECESNTSSRAFFTDFSKLLHVLSPVKVFLGGLNQKTEKATREYIALRLEQVYKLAKSMETQDPTEWYVGFWPSPKKDGQTSMWDQLQSFPHLDRTYLYYMSDNGFHEVVALGQEKP